MAEWLKSSEDILWGLAGDNFTWSFYRDAAIAHGEKWICLKDSKPTEKVTLQTRNEDESTMEVIFQIPKADSGQYTFGTGDFKALKIKFTVRIIDKPKSFQPSVTMDGSGKVLLKWKPPVTDLAIIGYEVECREEGETRWTKVTPYKVKDCSFFDNDIAPNKVYFYRVIAHNKIGQPWLSKPSDEFPYKIDGAPFCSELLKSSEDILWGLVGDDFTRSFYRDAEIARGEKWICLKDSISTDKVTFNKRNEDQSTMEGIFQFPKATKADSGQYTFGIGAKNVKALKMKTNITVRIIDKPKSFQPLVAMDKSGKVMVKWTSPVTDHLAIIGYEVECREEGETRWNKVTPYKVTDCNFVDNDIAPNKVYIYRVIAHNKIGQPWLSKPSDEFPYKIEPPAPMINASNTTTVTVGEPLELCVWITDTCDGVTWIKDEEVLNQGYVEDDKSVYRIEKATLENAGEYIFTAKNGSQSSIMKMNVVVREPPAPKINASNTTSVTVGEPLELCVGITDTCDGVTWKKEEEVLYEGKVEDGKSVYTIDKATLENTGEYTFTAMRGSKCSQMKMNVVVKENVLWNYIYYGSPLLAVVLCAIVMALYQSSSPNDTSLTTEIENIKNQLKLLSKPSGMDPNKRKIGLNDFDDGLTRDWNAVGKRLGKVEIRATQAVQEINSVLDKLQNITIPEIEALLLNHTNDIQNLTKWVKQLDTIFGSLKGEVEQLKKDFENAVNDSTKEIEGLHAEITPIIKELKNFTIKYQGLGEKLSEVKNVTKTLQELLDDNTDIIDSVRSKAANRESAQIVIAIVFIIEVGLGFWIYRIHRKVGSKVGVGPSSSKTAKEVLENIPRSVSLDRSICVIGFNKSDFNRGMITAALQGMNVSVDYTVVTRHEHLQGLPHCRLYVMCTEFTERHVIIEEQGLGLGDLKRCTHDVIQRLHANMVIIYIHDPGSRSLSQGHLFNNKIHCVSSQPELVRLREMKRFFSIYDKLTDNQISSFRDIVNSCLQLKY